MKKIQKFRHLSPSERYLLVKAFLLLNSVRLGFLFLKFPLLQRILGKIGRASAHKPAKSVISIDQIVWAVDASTRFSPGGAKCLARALTTQTLMQQQGYNSQLRIGVIHQPTAEFQAHAWIEYQGKIVVGMLPDLEKYNTLYPV